MRFKDYYETLGVARTATDAEIKSSFRKLARKHHPDMVPESGKAGAEERFKEINEAYEVLSDPEKRKRYDTLGADWDRQGGAPGQASGYGGWSGGGSSDFEFEGTGFSDFFERFFGGSQQGFYPGGGGGAATSRKGGDVEADLLVSLEDSLHGSTRELSLKRPGTAGGAKSFEVRIPAGVREGQRLRVAGQGNPGRSGAPAGDLYLRVRLARHPDFRVEGSDLYYDLNLAPWDAVLGMVTKVPVLGSRVSIKIPPGTSAGTQLRLRGHGLPKKGGERGDLYTSVQIQVPTQISAEEREHWEALARISQFKPEP
jgi:curved DNA-binding protein